MVGPYRVRDIWLATYAVLRGVPFLGVYRDIKGYAYWQFDPEQMLPVVGEWHAGKATVEIAKYHRTFLMLKKMIAK